MDSQYVSYPDTHQVYVALSKSGENSRPSVSQRHKPTTVQRECSTWARRISLVPRRLARKHRSEGVLGRENLTRLCREQENSSMMSTGYWVMFRGDNMCLGQSYYLDAVEISRLQQDSASGRRFKYHATTCRHRGRTTDRAGRGVHAVGFADRQDCLPLYRIHCGMSPRPLIGWLGER